MERQSNWLKLSWKILWLISNLSRLRTTNEHRIQLVPLVIEQQLLFNCDSFWTIPQHSHPKQNNSLRTRVVGLSTTTCSLFKLIVIRWNYRLVYLCVYFVQKQIIWADVGMVSLCPSFAWWAESEWSESIEIIFGKSINPKNTKKKHQRGMAAQHNDLGIY